VRLAAAGVCAALSVAACRVPRHAEPAHARHLVIVTIDTLRADHVGVYGDVDAATPHLDALARQGAMAIEATSQVPLTRPSHVTIFTGQLPTQTGIRDNISPAVVASAPLLAEVLKKSGFATGAFVSSVVLDASSGLGRGFDTYDAEFAGGSGAQFLNTLQRKGDATTAAAIAWLEKTRAAAPDGRVFVWLHLYEPHDPYEPPEPYASRFRERPYDGEVAFVDELVGRFDAALTRLGLAEDTALVVTSDHGEGLGDHSETLHGFFVYQTTLHVPLFVRGPGVTPGLRLTTTVQLVDLFPTVLELLAVPRPTAPLAGRSLAGILRGERLGTEAPVYAESLVPLLHFGWSDLRVFREGRFKYIQAPRPELYDLATDPGEKNNLATVQASRAEALRARLVPILDAERASAANSAGTAQAIAPELLEKLGALGYVGGGAPAETTTPGADPKDKVEDFRIANELMREGLLRLHDRDYAESVSRFQAVLARKVESFEVHFYLARSLAGLGRGKEAVAHFEEAARRSPAFAPAWEGLGDALLANGRKAEARKAYDKALPLAPRNAALHARVGDLARDLGDIDEAIRRQTEATVLAPDVASYWNTLGMTLGGSGRSPEAERAFGEATRLDAKNSRYAYNLGLILERQGRGAEARPWFEKSLALDPTFAPARDGLAGR